MIDWRRLFASAEGRTPRLHAWIGVVVIFLVSAVYEIAASELVHAMTFWIVNPLLLAAATCVLSKRLHDRGQSGWWAALVLIGFATLWPWPHGPQSVLGVVIMIWAVVELGVLPGEDGTNRYGPNPLTLQQ
jgi:uncharacterized membrane protein YhaH (DUF805 family)